MYKIKVSIWKGDELKKEIKIIQDDSILKLVHKVNREINNFFKNLKGE